MFILTAIHVVGYVSKRIAVSVVVNVVHGFGHARFSALGTRTVTVVPVFKSLSR